ncbi:MAG: hypothetical protein IBX56_00170 [Methylomicrobium sp.]|nr:hypothetical protein [Methylomicrobium sp.]
MSAPERFNPTYYRPGWFGRMVRDDHGRYMHVSDVDFLIRLNGELLAEVHRLRSLNKTERESGDQCPVCNCQAVTRYSSLNLKRCADCGHEWPWHLKPGQRPLVQYQR